MGVCRGRARPASDWESTVEHAARAAGAPTMLRRTKDVLATSSTDVSCVVQLTLAEASDSAIRFVRYFHSRKWGGRLRGS